MSADAPVTSSTGVPTIAMATMADTASTKAMNTSTILSMLTQVIIFRGAELSLRHYPIISTCPLFECQIGRVVFFCSGELVGHSLQDPLDVVLLILSAQVCELPSV